MSASAARRPGAAQRVDGRAGVCCSGADDAPAGYTSCECARAFEASRIERSAAPATGASIGRLTTCARSCQRHPGAEPQRVRRQCRRSKISRRHGNLGSLCTHIGAHRPGRNRNAATTTLLSPRGNEMSTSTWLPEGANEAKRSPPTLVVAEATARFHVASLLRQTWRDSNCTQAVTMAHRRGLL